MLELEEKISILERIIETLKKLLDFLQNKIFPSQQDNKIYE